MISLPDTEKNVAILFTGGVESFLLGKLCIEKYSRHNVIFVLWNMDEYNVFYKEIEKKDKVKKDFMSQVEVLGGYKTLVIDNNIYKQYDGYMVNRTLKIVDSFFSDVDYIIGGYNNIHKECYKLFLHLENNYDRSLHIQLAKLEVLTNKDEYPELNESVVSCEGKIYFVEEDFTFKKPEDLMSFMACNRLVSPLLNLTKHQVVESYVKLGLQDLLFKSVSCNRKGHTNHCGTCKNCLSRKLAIKKAGIKDETVYLC